MKRIMMGVLGALALQMSGSIGHAAAAAKSVGPKVMNLVGTISLGGDGWADYMIASPGTHRLYAGFSSENSLVIADTRTNKVIATIADLPGCHTVALDEKRHLGYSSNGQEDKVAVIDLRTNKVLRRIPGGHGPDGIIFDAPAQTVVVCDRRGDTLTLISAKTQKVTGTVQLGGSPESPAIDAKTGMIYQTLQDKNEVVVVDPKKKAVIKRFASAPGAGPTGLACDSVHHRIFCACQNQTLVVLDSNTGKLIAKLPIGGGVDFAGFDPALGRIYTANGSGTMTVIHEDSPNKYTVLSEVPTHDGGHALAVDTKTHRVYVVAGGMVGVYAAVAGR